MGKSQNQSFGLLVCFLTPIMSRAELDEAEKLRRRIWYFNVSRLSGLSDYELSCRFDLDIDAKSLRKKGAARRRIFERLRLYDEMPFRGRTEAFVNSVDAHQRIPALKGTAGLYFSPFWQLISSSSIPAYQLREFNLACARATGHFKVSGNFNESNAILSSMLDLPVDEYLSYLMDEALQYKEAVKDAFDNIPADLNIISLVGGLCRESLQAGKYQVAHLLEGYFSSLLEEVVEEEWIPSEIKGQLFSLTVARVRSPISPNEYNGMKYLESFDADENKGSPLAMLLDRHDRMLWNL